MISQTQEVHEEIADLLEQLRRLQDLQVTIEVRFITLADTFFERIGVDFDFNIQSGVNQPLNLTAIPTQSNGSNNPRSLGITAAPKLFCRNGIEKKLRLAELRPLTPCATFC